MQAKHYWWCQGCYAKLTPQKAIALPASTTRKEEPDAQPDCLDRFAKLEID